MYKFNSFKRRFGFSLLELLIAVSMVGILASLAYASYSVSIEKSRRSDAKRALLSLAGEQERWYMRENVYSPVIGDVGGVHSPEGYYTLSVSNTLDGASCSDQLCFTATADAGLAQANDDECQSFTIDNLGRKRAYNSSSAESDNCW